MKSPPLSTPDVQPSHTAGSQLSSMTRTQLWALFPICLEAYNPDWPSLYAAERDALVQLLGNARIARIRHIGSTAVPGLLAKPTIDILLEIRPDTDTAALIRDMTHAGYIHTPQPDNPPPHMVFYKGYTPEGYCGQVFHTHVRYEGDPDEPYFRDYFIAHEEAAKAYGALKTRLQKRYAHDRDAYTEAKTAFIRAHTRLARSYF